MGGMVNLGNAFATFSLKLKFLKIILYFDKLSKEGTDEL